MNLILVSIGAILLIALIVWWFFGSHKTSSQHANVESGQQTVTVTVDGGYSPNVVVLEKDTPATIVFDQKDSSSCLSVVQLPDFGISQNLPFGTKSSVKIDTSKSGEYQYSCGMNMFHGKVVIK